MLREPPGQARRASQRLPAAGAEAIIGIGAPAAFGTDDASGGKTTGAGARASAAPQIAQNLSSSAAGRPQDGHARAPALNCDLRGCNLAFQGLIEIDIGLGFPLVQRTQRFGGVLLEIGSNTAKSSSLILPMRWSKFNSRRACIAASRCPNSSSSDSCAVVAGFAVLLLDRIG